MIHKVIIFNY